ncbi:MAG: hypothetical protein JXA23_07640, partial [Bacteroidales bacterium]|nr:hypothetical protein [Bacteroidales bacterium]
EFKLTDEQKLELAKVVFTPHEFLKSPDVKYYPETVGKFFTTPIYEKMTGNIYLGYSYSEGIVFEGNRVGIDKLKVLEDTEPYKKLFVERVLKVTQQNGIEITTENTRFKMGICLVSVAPETTDETYAGLVAEMYINDTETKRTLFRRFYAGKRDGLELAMEDAGLQIVLTLKALKKHDEGKN